MPVNERGEIIRSGTAPSSTTPPPTTPTTRPATPAARPYTPPRAQSNSSGVLRTIGLWIFGLWVISSGINCINSSMRSYSSGSRSASTGSSSTSYTPEIRMLAPSKTWIKTKVMGIWKGSFDGDNAVLHIKSRKDNEFRGILTITATKGTYRLAIRGVLAGNGQVAMQETKALRLPKGAKWTLGIDTGTFGSDEQTMSGMGKDPLNKPYSWSFRRAS